MSERPRALMATYTYWDAPFQLGGHHIARRLVTAGWDVAFISHPISPFHLLQGRSDALRARYASYRNGGIRDLDGHLWAYVPGALLAPHRAPFLSDLAVHRGWWRVTFPSVVARVRSEGFESVDVVYLDSVVQGFWLDEIPHRSSVLRLGDKLDAFRSTAPAMATLERELARRVDLVVYSASTLKQHAQALGASKTLHLPNGVDFARFNGDPTMPGDLQEVPRPIAIYVGWLADWFDFGVINALTEAMPDVSFVMIGPDAEARARLVDRSNLYLLGPRPFESISAYLHHADVGLIPFDVAGQPDLVNNVQPLKLYEYLACGLPVVATSWTELRNLESPAILCETPGDFISGVRGALSQPFDRAAALDFARRADWRSRTDTLLRELDLP